MEFPIISPKAVSGWFLGPISAALGSSVTNRTYQFFQDWMTGKEAQPAPITQMDTFVPAKVELAPSLDLTERLDAPIFPTARESVQNSPTMVAFLEPAPLAVQTSNPLPVENPTLPPVPVQEITPPVNVQSTTQEADEDPEEFDPIPEDKISPKSPLSLTRPPIATPDAVAKNIGKSMVQLGIAGTTGLYYLVKRSFFSGFQGALEQGGEEMQKVYQSGAAKFPNVAQAIQKVGSLFKIQEIAQKAYSAYQANPSAILGAAVIAYGLYRWRKSPSKKQEHFSTNPGAGVIVNVNVAAPVIAPQNAPVQVEPNKTLPTKDGGCQCQHKSQ